ncbi:MAG: M20/M25/M40 family metallo-hydrolase [Coriobacteriia bacterium]|nr:M20/M25/M40 family metallo-hydrolase [Coriobacteriia bacterium]
MSTSAQPGQGTDVYRYLANEQDYPGLPADAAIEHLSRALQCRTVSSVDVSEIDYGELDKLHDLIRASYPHVMAAGTYEEIGHSLLITTPGTDPSLRPVQLMAHQDVVPVVPGTEADWTHDAFSGHVDDEFIWGRGAMDIKEMLIGELEAVEYLLAQLEAEGRQLKRTLILAFGEDEECLQQGSRAIAKVLAERGVRLEFLVDEGDYAIADGANYGAPGVPFKLVELGEKGYCDVRITVRSAGGHSSNPFGGTSLATLARAISRIVNNPYPLRLSPPAQATFSALAPRITEEPFASLVSAEGLSAAEAVSLNASHLAAECAQRRALYPLVTTTIAPDMIEGGSKGSNVMPQDMWAVINFRLDPYVTSADVMERCRELTADLGVELDMYQTPSEPTPADAGTGATEGLGMQVVSEAVAHFLHDPSTGSGLSCVPALATGGTDAHMYEGICDACLRLGPMVVDADEQHRGVHGTDERVTKRGYLQGIRMLVRIVEKACL